MVGEFQISILYNLKQNTLPPHNIQQTVPNILHMLTEVMQPNIPSCSDSKQFEFCDVKCNEIFVTNIDINLIQKFNAH